MLRGIWCAGAMVGIVVAAGSAAAQDRQQPPERTAQQPERRGQEPQAERPAAGAVDMAAIVQAMEEGTRKTKEHAELAQAEGMWSFEGKHWMAPGSPAGEMTGTVKMKSILDGRWLQEKVESEVEGMPFQGISMVGFDSVRGKYISTWVDSMSNGMMYSEGEAQPDGSIVLQGKVSCPIAKDEKPVKIVMRNEGRDKMKFEMFEPAPGTGEMFKVMELNYTRTGPLPRDEADGGRMKGGMERGKGG